MIRIHCTPLQAATIATFACVSRILRDPSSWQPVYEVHPADGYSLDDLRYHIKIWCQHFIEVRPIEVII